ncbi:hypothetical protein [Lichenihabitans psoromatis]|uniref:hypothetical protein n=1 Tax=Lichenihabitans psoromatis TaxID=2528642 RepID=UPI003CCAC3E3
MLGGSEQDVTAGVGWYPDRNVRVLADYVHGWTDPPLSQSRLAARSRATLS